MNQNPNSDRGIQDINLVQFLKDVWNSKWLFALSLITCLGLAYLIAKILTPKYDIESTVLVDSTGKTRKLGESRSFDGGVGLIDVEKNLINEIGIFKSYSLIDQTVRSLRLNSSYFSKSGLKKREHFDDFPFSIDISDTLNQVIDQAFTLIPIDDETFRIQAAMEKFYVINEFTKFGRPFEQPLTISGTYQYGEPIYSDFYNFTVYKNDLFLPQEEEKPVEYSFKVHSYNNVTNRYKTNLKVVAIDVDGNLIKLSTKGAVPDRDILFLNKLSEIYIQSKLDERNEIARKKEDFIQSQLDGIAQSLTLAESRLENYRSGSNSVDLERSASLSIEQQKATEMARDEAQTNLSYYEALLNNLQRSNSSAERIIAPSMAGISDPVLDESILDLKDLYTEREKNRLLKGEKSFELQVIDKKIINGRNAILDNLTSAIQQARFQVSEKKNQLAELQTTITQLPGKVKRDEVFSREKTRYEDTYNYLSRELAKTRIAGAENISDIKIVDRARIVGIGPSFPPKGLIYAFAAMLGLLLPLLWIFVKGLFVKNIKSEVHLQRLINLPVLSSIKHNRKPGSTVFQVQGDFSSQESFIELSSKIYQLAAGSGTAVDPHDQKLVIGITSYGKGDGKTYSALNLATYLANQGKKVLTIDYNMRKPDLSGYFEIREGANLNRFVVDPTVTARDIVQNGYPNLSIVASEKDGTQINYPRYSYKMLALLSELKDKYDIIIIDTPAVGLTADYYSISNEVDLHLLIVRKDKTKIKDLRQLENISRDWNNAPIGVVLNDVKTKTDSYT